MPQVRAVGTGWNGHTNWDIETADCGGEGSDRKSRCPHSIKREPGFSAPRPGYCDSVLPHGDNQFTF